MNIQQAKEIDIVDYLQGLGFEPAKVSGKSYWYCSPFREEKTASFKVNRNLNRWFDFAEGRGGNLVDFGVQFFGIRISDFLQRPDLAVIPSNQVQPKNAPPLADEDDNNCINIRSVQEISSYPLLRYLHTRRISNQIANKYLKEVRYQTGQKMYYALGFKNDAGGYELRNEHFKGSSSPKDITFIDNGANNMSVFEGFFNFLSYKAMYHEQQEPLSNFLILNSASFFEKSLPKMQVHNTVRLFLDNDKTGDKYTAKAIATDVVKFRDERRLYQKYDDLNDWLINIGKSQKQQLRQKF